MSKNDFFQDRKGIHVKLERDVHNTLRIKLFQHNLSMQEIFDEFARLYAADDPRASKIVDDLILRKVRAFIENSPAYSPIKNRRTSRVSKTISELDHDMLYNMINEEKK